MPTTSSGRYACCFVEKVRVQWPKEYAYEYEYRCGLMLVALFRVNQTRQEMNEDDET